MDFLSFREEVTKYIFAEDVLQKADIILIPGNAYPQNAERAAALYRQGYAPYILPSGKYSTLVGHFAGVCEKADRYNKEYKTEWEFLKDVLVQNQVGLHARPATFFSQKDNEFKSSIWVEKEERRVNAKSLLGVLSLGIMGGTKIRIIAGGPDEEQAVEELVKLVESGFAE